MSNTAYKIINKKLVPVEHKTIYGLLAGDVCGISDKTRYYEKQQQEQTEKGLSGSNSEV